MINGWCEKDKEDMIINHIKDICAASSTCSDAMGTATTIMGIMILAFTKLHGGDSILKDVLHNHIDLILQVSDQQVPDKVIDAFENIHNQTVN